MLVDTTLDNDYNSKISIPELGNDRLQVGPAEALAAHQTLEDGEHAPAPRLIRPQLSKLLSFFFC